MQIPYPKNVLKGVLTEYFSDISTNLATINIDIFTSNISSQASKLTTFTTTPGV